MPNMVFAEPSDLVAMLRRSMFSARREGMKDLNGQSQPHPGRRIMSERAGALRSGKGHATRIFPSLPGLFIRAIVRRFLAFYEFVRVADDMADIRRWRHKKNSTCSTAWKVACRQR